MLINKRNVNRKNQTLVLIRSRESFPLNVNDICNDGVASLLKISFVPRAMQAKQKQATILKYRKIIIDYFEICLGNYINMK